MADQELAFDQVNVRFDRAETESERIEERTLVLIIVVSEAGGQERSAIAFAERNEENNEEKEVRFQRSGLLTT